MMKADGDKIEFRLTLLKFLHVKLKSRRVLCLQKLKMRSSSSVGREGRRTSDGRPRWERWEGILEDSKYIERSEGIQW